ncbi:hypothetical protein QTG54_004074 [Skeletonema marinoi]|uniref:Sulfotransferase domain-containing protein n=1 Tax=Skeletonema marinoi TaxID=267567 RepID=A0AAD8YF97_9STRA|nr:hypothetical protein QTG54_004074 [Skeletonema marinoi]
MLSEHDGKREILPSRKGRRRNHLFSLVENGIVVRRDHPRPSTHGIEELLSGHVTTLLINIRDPLDRFVSAFNWRSLLFCQRVESIGRSIHLNKHTKFISHAKLSMEGWLRPLLLDTNTTSIKPQGLTKFMAITFEQQSGHNSSLLEHTHEAVQQLYFDHGVDEETLDILMSRKTLRLPRVSEMMTHSSNSTAKRKVLGAVGKCCLARFLEDDYRLIQSMLGDANASNVLDPFEYVHPIIREACEWGFQHEGSCAVLICNRCYIDEQSSSIEASERVEMQ